ncbi:hypothetical protein PGTUg99_009501 [Puccinia graminis f. sp. tritici]|uniref:Uncharacterized protein n=1 Tax=Puccinia graminis f. sp. tritici TaxID=56615 RepID=A0A5B0P734_PUCGR|nr:hypothetical protein PGTUg99_009501 [Puccinia graminis f. sp. tritici]
MTVKRPLICFPRILKGTSPARLVQATFRKYNINVKTTDGSRILLSSSCFKKMKKDAAPIVNPAFEYWDKQFC